jgi:hypothetical protein
VYRLRVSVVAELNVGCRSTSKWRDARYLLMRLVQLPSASWNLHVDSTTFIQVPSFATSTSRLWWVLAVYCSYFRGHVSVGKSRSKGIEEKVDVRRVKRLNDPCLFLPWTWVLEREWYWWNVREQWQHALGKVSIGTTSIDISQSYQWCMQGLLQHDSIGLVVRWETRGWC